MALAHYASDEHRSYRPAHHRRSYHGAGRRSESCGFVVGLPGPRQQFVDALDLMVGQPGQNVECTDANEGLTVTIRRGPRVLSLLFLAGRDGGAERGLFAQAAASRLAVAGGIGCQFHGSRSPRRLAG